MAGDDVDNFMYSGTYEAGDVPIPGTYDQNRASNPLKASLIETPLPDPELGKEGELVPTRIIFI